MINAGFVDLAFNGAAILPDMLMFADLFGDALLLLMPLLIVAGMLIVACLINIYHDLYVSDDPSSAPEDSALVLDTVLGDREPHQA